MTQSILSIMQKAPVIPVIVVNKLEQALPLAKTLVESGLPVLEVTLRTPVALEAINLIKQEIPEAVVGAGTVTNTETLEQAIKAGSEFIVSPGSTDKLITAALATQTPILPGASSPSEVMRLLEHGITEMKFFPAEASGGVAMLKSIGAPLPQVTFCPTGGISPDNAPAYLALDNVACVGGSWMVNSSLTEDGNWDEIRRLATSASQLKA